MNIFVGPAADPDRPQGRDAS